MNIKNLIKARDAILGCDPELFDMKYYRASNGEPVTFYNHHNCGTIGCFLGWMPFVDGLEALDKEVFLTIGSNFIAYAKRLFELDWDSLVWIFATEWSNIDNTPIGAALRCNYLIEHGRPPDNWRDQLNGFAPYIFAEEIK